MRIHFSKSAKMKWILAALGLAATAQAHKLTFLSKARTMTVDGDLCGQGGFDALNQGSKDYFDTIQKSLWVHPGNTDGFAVFKQELQCWYSKMLSNNCGGNAPNDARKADLYADCTSSKADYLNIWKRFSDEEFKYFKQTFPSDKDAEFNQAMTTMKNMNLKEVLCTTLFVIDDGCVAYKYVKKA